MTNKTIQELASELTKGNLLCLEVRISNIDKNEKVYVNWKGSLYELNRDKDFSDFSIFKLKFLGNELQAVGTDIRKHLENSDRSLHFFRDVGKELKLIEQSGYRFLKQKESDLLSSILSTTIRTILKNTLKEKILFGKYFISNSKKVTNVLSLNMIVYEDHPYVDLKNKRIKDLAHFGNVTVEELAGTKDLTYNFINLNQRNPITDSCHQVIRTINTYQMFVNRVSKGNYPLLEPLTYLHRFESIDKFVKYLALAISEIHDDKEQIVFDEFDLNEFSKYVTQNTIEF